MDKSGVIVVGERLSCPIACLALKHQLSVLHMAYVAGPRGD